MEVGGRRQRVAAVVNKEYADDDGGQRERGEGEREERNEAEEEREGRLGAEVGGDHEGLVRWFWVHRRDI